jgi:peptide/nickel transport system permease protein
VSGTAPLAMRARMLPRTIALPRATGISIVAYAVVFGWVIVALVAPAAAPYDPRAQSIAERLTAPDLLHPLGTDYLGRDVLSLVMYGARLSIPVGLAAVLLAVFVGTLAGSIAGLGSGAVDELVMRTSDLVLAFPPLMLALVITASLGAGVVNAIVAIMIAWWPKYARLLRALILSIREREYVVAARSLGARLPHLLVRHILPNAISPLIVLASLDVGNAILTFASLSFLGLGPPPDMPEWGAAIAAARDYFDVQWWIGVFPGLALLSLTLGFNIIGDDLRDRLDPTRRSATH